jgi:hypothetical protein
MSLRPLLASALAVVVLLCAACGGGSDGSTTSTAAGGSLAPLSTLGKLEPAPALGKPGGELVAIPKAPPLAPAASQATASHDVDGIKCEHNAKLVFHVHTHVTVFVDGKQRTIPAGVGVDPPIGPDNYRPSPIGPQFGEAPGQCLAWLSTRYADGLIHVESSEQRSFTLGDFFEVWGQPLSKDELGPEQGDVTAIVNKQAWTGDPADIPLESHTQIQLMLGKPLVAPQTIQFPGAY